MIRRWLFTLSLLLGLCLSACDQSPAPRQVGRSASAPDEFPQLIAAADACADGPAACDALRILQARLEAKISFNAEDLAACLDAARTDAVQYEIVRAYTPYAASTMLPTLKPLLTADDYSLRRAAQKAVAAIDSEEAVGALLAVLQVADDKYRRYVPSLLARHAKSDTVKAGLPELIRLAEHPEDVVFRRGAVQAVGAAGEVAHLPWLMREAQADDDLTVRIEAVKALAHYAKRPEVLDCLARIAGEEKHERLADLARRVAQGEAL